MIAGHRCVRQSLLWPLLRRSGDHRPARVGVDVAGIASTGLQGCVRYTDGTRDLPYTQAEYANLVEELPVAEVVMTHCPPTGINDHPRDPAHVGIDALRGWIDTHVARVQP